MIESIFAANYLPLLTAYIKGQPLPVMQSGNTDNDDADNETSVEETPTVALIKVRGVMTKHNQYCGERGMVTVANELKYCMNEDRIKAVIFDIESPGGESYACLTIAEAIKNCTKPVIAYINDYAYSAAYIGFCGCDLIIANTEFAQTGSIGVMTTIVDFSKQLEKEGISIIDLYASQSKDKNIEIREALDGNTEKLQRQLDFVCEKQVIDAVSNNRNEALGTNIDKFAGRAQCLADVKEWGTGKTFFAPEALKLGLIDGIATKEEVISWFI